MGVIYARSTPEFDEITESSLMPIIHVEADEDLIIQFVKEKLKDEKINQKYELPHIRSDLIICSRKLIEKAILART